MPKQIKEFLFDQTTGEINTEYDDNTTEKFNLASVNQAVSSQAAAIAAVEGRVSGGVVTTTGLNITVSGFTIESFTYDGGAIELPSAGTWYIGVELSSKLLRCLPRLGHRGWIPVGRVVCTESSVVDLQSIKPVLPPCRIPRVMQKLLRGQSIKTLVLGSSLTASTGPNSWSGMVLDGASGATSDKYLLSGAPVLKNMGLGGAPNMYSLAQLGKAEMFFGTMGYSSATAPSSLTKASGCPIGRSSLFFEHDLVVIGMLANGGDYRIECLEPILRNLKKIGIEVIVLTDNAQGPSTDYATAMAAGLFVDGPELMRLADLYGFEIADTAAYVMEAHIRAGGVGIYSDTIHMSSAAPAGPSAAPSCGHEVWARALRSVFPLTPVPQAASSPTYTRDFDDGLTTDLVSQNATYGNFAVVDGKLVATKTSASTGQWGVRIKFPTEDMAPGDSIRITGNASWVDYGAYPVVGLQGGGSGWGSNVDDLQPSGGAFDAPITATRVIPAGQLQVLFFGNKDNAALGSAFSLDNLTFEFTRAARTTLVDAAPTRRYETKSLPKSRIVTDMKTPGDAYVTLPHMEPRIVANHANKGTLQAHPSGENSFARRFSPDIVGSSQDLLVLATGQEAVICGLGVVSLAAILYSQDGNPAATIEIRTGSGTVVRTINIAAQTLTREVYQPLMTPTDFAASGSETADAASYILAVTSGTVRVAALVVQTSEHEVLPVAVAEKVGTWSGLTSGGGSGLLGIYTDTVGDYLKYHCPPDARRLRWIVSGRPNSQAVHLQSGREILLNAAMTGGVSHIWAKGCPKPAPGSDHFIQLAASVGTGNVTSGYSLHVGGIVLTYDR